MSRSRAPGQLARFCINIDWLRYSSRGKSCQVSGANQQVSAVLPFKQAVEGMRRAFQSLENLAGEPQLARLSPASIFAAASSNRAA